VRCTTGAGAGAGTVLVVLEKDMQPAPSVMAARTNPRGKNFIMQVPQQRPFRCSQAYLVVTFKAVRLPLPKGLSADQLASCAGPPQVVWQ
jgi:hypothetical protein